MEKSTNRTIGFHPCVGKKASGEDRPTTVVIRTADDKHAVYEFKEQQLLDFFTCGVPTVWRNATVEDLSEEHPLHHLQWVDATEKEYEACADADRERLFRLKQSTTTVVGQAHIKIPVTDYRRSQVPAELVCLNPETDRVGVANGGLGMQIMEILLGRYPGMDVCVIGSGTLKEARQLFDALLPATIRKKAEKVRVQMEKRDEASGNDVEDNEDDNAMSNAAAKNANAKFDAHRIAYALADNEGYKLFHRCTLRDRDWAGANIAYGNLESARNARVATEQQFRQAHRTALRLLAMDPRIPFVSLAVTDEDEAESQSIEVLLQTFKQALNTCGYTSRDIEKRLRGLRQAHARIGSARDHEKDMSGKLEDALRALPEYTEFLPKLKRMVHTQSGMPLGKYIGERIFGRWIAGFGSPMLARLNEPMRPTDADRIEKCRTELSSAIQAINRTGLPEQPQHGNGKTREWLLACTRLFPERNDIRTAHNAYRRLVNAKKAAASRPLNRAIAAMGLHVRQGGKYADTLKQLEFPRRRRGKGMRANWDEKHLRQGAYQWVTLIIKGGDSHWKVHVYEPHKTRRMAEGVKRGHAHKHAIWRTATVALRWLLSEWFKWEREHTAVV